jgi:cell division protein FtsW
VVLRVPIDRVEQWAPWALGGSMILLILVIATPLGLESKGARRWLRLGPMTIQPSEFAKIAMVLYMAKFLADKRDKIRNLREGFIPAVCITAVFCVLILLEKDLGTIILMGSVILGMWALAQVRLTHLATIIVAALPAVVYLVFQHSYRVHRVLAFLNPEKYQMTHGYQLNQSLIAVGSGGIFGTGLGTGLQKYHFLSESHTDFIYAIVCEELGFVGALSVALLFFAFVAAGFRISYRAPDYFSGLAAAGLTMVVGWAAFINFFVVLGMAPTKGLALPFFSYGGSSMIASLLGVALLISFANYSVARPRPKEALG